MQSSTSVLPHSPNIIVPRQCVLTLRPVPPSVLYSIARPYHRAPIGTGGIRDRGLQSNNSLDGEGNGVELNHDSLMGVILIAAGVLTFPITRNPSDTLKILALLGAAGSVIIGALLLFQIA